jgi:hypothetical protein
MLFRRGFPRTGYACKDRDLTFGNAQRNILHFFFSRASVLGISRPVTEFSGKRFSSVGDDFCLVLLIGGDRGFDFSTSDYIASYNLYSVLICSFLGSKLFNSPQGRLGFVGALGLGRAVGQGLQGFARGGGAHVFQHLNGAMMA